ncbi:MAG TPA: hypothetical protein VD996_01770 [Chitinophagaceae bacterium]|nr:hypothetical protein [Chitinophagaceae bacterium]
MKAIITSALIVLLLLNVTALKAQKKEPMPDYGSWQLVTNVSDKSRVTVQFFSSDGILMYEETLYNTRLNMNRRKTLRRLNAVLKHVHETWVKNKEKLHTKDLSMKLRS